MVFFGPRGLETALFALVISKYILGEYGDSILIFAINAVWMRTLIHGISAAPMANWYGAKIKWLKIKSIKFSKLKTIIKWKYQNKKERSFVELKTWLLIMAINLIWMNKTELELLV